MKEFKQFTLDDWIDYTQQLHWRSIDLTLDRVAEVWQALHLPLPEFIITVAGTNGKGSSVAMFDAVFQAQGKKTGAYTSPYLICYNERIRLSGEMVSDELLCEGFCEIESVRGNIPLTYFEFGTLCAMWIFVKQGVDVAILEVGMGGVSDAVNVFDSNIALITTIDFDHEKWLGSDREQIGAQKAGVMRKNGLAVCADPSPPSVIGETASNLDVHLLQFQTHFFVDTQDGLTTWSCTDPEVGAQWKEITELRCPLDGDYQIRNLAGVIATLALSAAQTGISVDHLRGGLNNVHIDGRCQIISTKPEIIIDVAHNRQSAQELGHFLASRPELGDKDKTIAVVGILEDKSVKDLIGPVLPYIDSWYLASLPGDRAQTSQQLSEKLAKLYAQTVDNRSSLDHEVVCFDSPVLAYQAATQEMSNDDRLVIFGSFYTVGDILGSIRHNQETD